MNIEIKTYPIIGRSYKHYKGGTYKILRICKHTETDEILVICESLEYGSWHPRPLDVFNETGKFTLIDDNI